MNRITRRLFVPILVCLMLALTLSAARAQDATVEASATPQSAQITVGVEPDLGFQLLSAALGPHFYGATGFGGGTNYYSPGTGCVSGYTSIVPSLGVIWTTASGPVSLSFTSSQADTNVSLLMWDLAAAKFWCSPAFAPSSALTFSDMGKGVYFLWVLNEKPAGVAGQFSVDTVTIAPAPEPTVVPETTVVPEATANPEATAIPDATELPEATAVSQAAEGG